MHFWFISQLIIPHFGKFCNPLDNPPGESLQYRVKIEFIGRKPTMKIGLVYAMTGEIESLLTQENAQPLQTVAGVPFYQIRPALRSIWVISMICLRSLSISRYI